MIQTKPDKPLTTLAIIGDIHTEDQYLATALNFSQQQAVDAILAVGDIADGHGDINQCCQLLQQYQVITVKGNHDRWLLMEQLRHLSHADQRQDISIQTYDYLTQLPQTIDLTTIGGKLLLCHGLGENDMASLKPDDDGYALENNLELKALLSSDYQWVIHGHTHQVMVRYLKPIWFLNAGTLKRSHTSHFMIVDLSQKQVKLYQIAHADTKIMLVKTYTLTCENE